ncbi:MAG: aldolase/citrate lyase family protein [Bacteroidales bacterium]
MSENIAYAGNKGENVRSDCFVTLELRGRGGNDIDIQSTVKAIYGEAIQDMAKAILNFYEVKSARLDIEDTGALPLVIAARIETALKELVGPDEPYLLPMLEENRYASKVDQFRYSHLYLPGNTPKMMINAGIHQPDGVVLDLEDSVAPNKRREARFLVRNALRGLNFHGAERMVRINRFPAGLKDLKYVVPHNVHVVLIPKCEVAEQVYEVEKEIHNIKDEHHTENDIFLMPVIESAQGVENAYDIALASDEVVAMAIGLEDYTADIGAQRTSGGYEAFYARSRIVNACRAAGIQPIDSVFSDVGNEAGLKSAVKESKSMGFEGMGCIHPRQIKPVREGFAPGEEEIEEAKKIVNASYEAEQKGLGVVALGTKMVDPPVVKRAQKTLDLAIFLGLIPESWREKFIS